MKSFISIVSLSLSLASLVWAAPTIDGPLPPGWKSISRDEILAELNSSPVESNNALVKRTPGNVRLCTGPGWTNTCATVPFTLNSCMLIPEPWFESVGSIGPDPGALCRLTTSSTTGCTAHGDLFIQFPGFADLYNHNGIDYAHSARFMLCQSCSGCT